MTVEADTIFALSSGRPPAAIAVVRVSGPRSRDAAMALAGRLPPPRQATLTRLRAAGKAGEEALDDALLLWFPAPHSETGEDVVEFQLHGGRAVVAAVLASLARMPGLRLAKAGEFTRRAFTNGKLDLTRVEALADLIGADTEAQRRQAVRQLNGLIGDQAERWRARLIQALALAEAAIDFPDEGDVPPDLLRPALAIAAELEREIRAVLGDSHRGERLREGLTVTIAGPVNVGKSTIINRLARRPAAIVSPFPGTTRDVIEVHLDLGGYPVTVIDTAGLRKTADPVEQEGVRRAQERAAAADLVLWVIDAGETPPMGGSGVDLGEPGPTIWLVFNKCDLLQCNMVERNTATALSSREPPGRREFRISAQTGRGFDTLVTALADHAARFFDSTETALITRQRHRSLLTACADALRRSTDENGREEIVAEELRSAAWSLGRLTGRVDVDDVLDVIFRDFCIGK